MLSNCPSSPFEVKPTTVSPLADNTALADKINNEFPTKILVPERSVALKMQQEREDFAKKRCKARPKI